jgi:hypothetical protein
LTFFKSRWGHSKLRHEHADLVEIHAVGRG